MQTISTPDAPAPLGHYSQAVVHNGVVYVSGQLAIDPKTGAARIDSIEEEAEQVLRNLQAVLEASGSSAGKVLKTTVYLSDMRRVGERERSVREVLRRPPSCPCRRARPRPAERLPR